MDILHVVGARPNFMKAAPVWQALTNKSVQQTLVHTGQHYDMVMSEVFFQELSLPRPDQNLEVGSGSHAQQTAAIMQRLESVILKQQPRLVLVYGDVNSTLAASLVAAKLRIAIGHVEAGLRSHDRSMPEEINRIVTDQLADLLFTPSQDGNENLANEGIPASRIHFVGNVMIDTVVNLLPHLRPLPDLPPRYLLVTLHRAANVDDEDWLRKIFTVLQDLSEEIPVVFPVHPRTRSQIQRLNIDSDGGNLRLLPPLTYKEFLFAQRWATAVITDSGGIQEESTFLGIPCFTVRENTERPVTISLGTNTLVGRDPEKLRRTLQGFVQGERRPTGGIPPLWDGKAGCRIAGIITKWLMDEGQSSENAAKHACE